MAQHLWVVADTTTARAALRARFALPPALATIKPHQLRRLAGALRAGLTGSRWAASEPPDVTEFVLGYLRAAGRPHSLVIEDAGTASAMDTHWWMAVLLRRVDPARLRLVVGTRAAYCPGHGPLWMALHRYAERIRHPIRVTHTLRLGGVAGVGALPAVRAGGSTVTGRCPGRPVLARLWAGLGGSAIEAGDEATAVRCFDRAVALQPGEALAAGRAAALAKLIGPRPPEVVRAA